MARFPLTAWVFCALASLVLAQSQSAYPITGVKVASGSAVPLRQNVDDLRAKGGPQWDLYIRSLADLYNQDSRNQVSYFQIGGIHGRPYIQWNGGGAARSNGWQGYCPHGENLFLPWHRPYVLLFEQRLVETAVKLANQYPTQYRSTYLAAARSLRAPYWDWAAKPSVPSATLPTSYTVQTPSGSKLAAKKISNPLRYYRFPARALNGEFGTFDRSPNQIQKCLSPQSYPNSANQAMAGRSYKQWTYDALTKSTTFNQFSSTGNSGISLEQIHNSIHWDGSCGQQFLDADYSAFDPLFMLHHTQVDRLWAYWQAMRPSQALFTGSYRGAARYSTPAGTTITPNSPLNPFFKAPGQFYTSNSVKSIKGFGYTYKGLEYWQKSDSQMARDATTLVNQLYGTGVSRPQRKRQDNGPVTRYFAQIQVNVEELERPCAIQVSTNTTTIGNLFVLTQPATGNFFGQLSLDTLVPSDTTQTANVTQTVANLTSTLRVEIKKRDGTVVPLTSVPSLTLQVENIQVVPPVSDAELPVYKAPQLKTVSNKVLKTRPPKVSN